MQYYLSYVERKGHAALILSVQKSPAEPVEILYEFGFFPAGDYKYLNIVEGVVIEEDNASRVLYSQPGTVQHRTYPISESEFNQCLAKLNADRRKNIDKRVQTTRGKSSWMQGGGPDYQYLLFNCKEYALSMFREIGIVDVKQLSNFAIQRPGTTDFLMRKLEKEDLSCPLKDAFFEGFNKNLKLLLEKLVLLKNMEEKLIFLPGNQEKKSLFFSNVEFMINLCRLLKDYAKKLGIHSIEGENEKCFKQAQAVVTNISQHVVDISFSGSSEVDSEALSSILRDIETLQMQLTGQHDKMSAEMDKLKREGRVNPQGNMTFPVFWKRGPTISPRLDLKNFTDDEKDMYLIKIKMAKISEGLEAMSLLCGQKITELREQSKDPIEVVILKQHVDVSIVALKKQNQFFLESLTSLESVPHKPGKEILEAYLVQNNALDNVLQRLDEKMSSYNPTSQQNTSRLSRVFRHMINYFKKDYEVLGVDPKYVLQKKLAHLERNPAVLSKSIATKKTEKNLIKNKSKSLKR